MLVKVTVAGLSVLGAPLLALFALAALAAGAVSASASSGQALFDPSDDALNDIPPLMLSLYVARAAACPGLPWQVLAGIAKVESDHGRFSGATIDVEGTSGLLSSAARSTGRTEPPESSTPTTDARTATPSGTDPSGRSEPRDLGRSIDLLQRS